MNFDKGTKTVILDSSVVAKWILPEEGSDEALAIKDRFTSQDLALTAPLLLYYELNNILRTAVKARRIESKDAATAFAAFLRLNIVTYSSASLLEKTLAVALRCDISSYDASYVALAEDLAIPCITADDKLLKKVNNQLVVIDLHAFVLPVV